MHAERNYLIKHVFPDIERECHRRNVIFRPLDLRWGITEEESRQGKVIELCLEHIRRTRPFFIGLIGDKYGWVPNEGETHDYSHLSNNFPTQPQSDFLKHLHLPKDCFRPSMGRIRATY